MKGEESFVYNFTECLNIDTNSFTHPLKNVPLSQKTVRQKRRENIEMLQPLIKRKIPVRAHTGQWNFPALNPTGWSIFDCVFQVAQTA